MSASVFPSAAIHAFPKAGPYQIPPTAKLTIVATITPIKKFASNMTDMRSACSARRHKPVRYMVFPGPDEDPRRPVQPGSGTDPGDGLARGAGAGAPPAVFFPGLVGFRKTPVDGV